ncbi:MAG: phosphoribosylglycinamide formyltransferase, partial [Amphiplicatus sp.]|nr:phosphoribosylglycinamide formyltransferase [Amphiplicatus sp.]
MARKKLAVLISGRGSNLQSLLDAAAAKDFPAEIALVISNKPDAGGLARAEKAGVPQLTINHRDFGKGPAARAAFDGALSDALAKADVDFICLAG